MKRKLKKNRRKKKGFTLIELLAVILILGIIALIAIPTVNSVIEQSRKGAFESTVNNLIKAAETKCNLELLNRNNITRIYIIKNGVVTPPLDLKGNLPQNGTIFIDDNCEATINVSNGSYFTAKTPEEDKVEVKKEVERTEVLPTYFDGTADGHAQVTEVKARVGYSIMYHDETIVDKIVSVSTVYGIPTEEKKYSWDFSHKKDKSIIAWLEPNGDNYDLYIGSNGVITPTSTRYWFAKMINVKTFRFENLDTSKLEIMSHMFSGDSSTTKLDLSDFNTSNVTDMYSAFNYMYNLQEFIIGPKFTADKVTTIGQSFRKATSLKKLDLSYFKGGDKLTSISYAFEGCTSLEELDISGLKMNSLTSIGGAFNIDRNLKRVYVNSTWRGNIQAAEGKEYVKEIPDGENIFIRK